MKAFLEYFAAILGAVTATLLAMSWTHEYGYFWAIGEQFQTFLTTTDYIANGSLWLPLGVLFIFQSITFRSLAVDPPAPKENRRAWVTRPIWWALFAVWSIFSVSALTWPVDYAGAFNLMILAVIFWSRAWRVVFADINLDEPFQLIARELIRLGPLVILGTLLYGFVNAQTDLTRTDSVYLFKFKDATNPRLLVFLRTFDRGVLARDAVHERIIFTKWDDIKEISLVSPKVSNSLLCWMTGWSCKAKHKDQRAIGAPDP